MIMIEYALKTIVPLIIGVTLYQINDMNLTASAIAVLITIAVMDRE